MRRARRRGGAAWRGARQCGRAALLAQTLQDRLRKYGEEQATVAASLERDPEIPTREKQANSEVVTAQVQILTELWREVMPYIRRIKTLAGDLLNPTRFSACYFLFGKVSNGMEAALILAHEGFHYEVMEIIRSNREAFDLIVLFLREPPDSLLLKKWFEGEIINNAKARAAVEAFFVAVAREHNIPLLPGGMQSDIYKVLSRYTHVSFDALLDSYDVHRKDFDFDRVAGYHHVLTSSLPFLGEQISSAFLALKTFYLSIEDADSGHGIDAVLQRLSRLIDDDTQD
jgi:hypothetical protein